MDTPSNTHLLELNRDRASHLTHLRFSKEKLSTISETTVLIYNAWADCLVAIHAPIFTPQQVFTPQQNLQLYLRFQRLSEACHAFHVMKECDECFLISTVRSAQMAAEDDFQSMRDSGKLEEAASHLRERLETGEHPALEERCVIKESAKAGATGSKEN